MHNTQDKYDLFENKKEQAEAGGGEARIAKYKATGRLTARERINLFFDQGTFNEFDKMATHRCVNFGMADNIIPGDGVVAGYGKVDGRLVFAFAQDFTVFGGSLSRTNADKIIKVMQKAMKMGAPVVGLNDSGGARIQEGVLSLAGYGDIFQLNVKASGVIPQVSAIMGPCAGGAVYSPAITDFIFMVKDSSYMFVTGPEVIKTVTHQDVSKDELGGPMTHNSKSGVAHFIGNDDEHTLMMIRELLGFIPSNNMDEAPTVPTLDPADRMVESIQHLIPADPNKPYDMHEIIKAVADDEYLFEVMPYYAKNIITAYARLNGKTVAVVANQPEFLAGVLDINSSVKAARFVRFCDAFNIPIVTFVDVPGFLPGIVQEHGGIIKHGAKLLYAYAEATVPKITVITRKAYGGAYDVMASKHLSADVNFAYPSAEIAVMGPAGAVNIIFRNEKDEEAKAKRVADYRDNFANPYKAAELGYIDEIIYPNETRKKLIAALDMCKNKRDENPPKKHGNIPL